MSVLARCTKKRCQMPLTLDPKSGAMRCVSCVRNAMGYCRCCPNRLTWRFGRGCGASQFCPACRRARVYAQDVARRPQKYAKRHAWGARPENRERLNAEARAWRAANPPTDLDRLYERAKHAQRKADPVKAAHDRAVRRAWYSRPEVKAEQNARQRARRRQSRVAVGA